MFIEYLLLRYKFTKALLLSETHRRLTCLIWDPSKTSTCFIGDWHVTSETNMPDQRLIGDWHVTLMTDMPVKTHRRPTCLRKSNRNFNTCLFKYSYFYILFAYFYIGIIYWGMSVSDGFRWSMSISSMDLP